MKSIARCVTHGALSSAFKSYTSRAAARAAAVVPAAVPPSAGRAPSSPSTTLVASAAPALHAENFGGIGRRSK